MEENSNNKNNNPTQDAIKDTAAAAVGTAKAIGKAAVGDVGGAAIETVKVLPQLLKIIGVILLINFILLGAFLAAPAMIWDNMTKPYHEWCFTKATETIDDAFNKAASKTASSAMDSINYYIPNYIEKRNQFFSEGQGGVSKLFDNDGNEFLIAVDETGKDILITYYDAKKKDYTEIRYVDGNNFINSPVNVNYTEIINAFTYYRSKNKDENTYNFTYDENKNITGTTASSDASGVWKDSKDFETRAWGMTDCAAIYKFITSEESLNNIYNIKYLVGKNKQEIKDITNSKAMDMANNEDLAKTNNYDHYYQITIDVSTFDSDMKTTTDGKMTYSAFSQNMFNLSNEDMDYVAQVTALSNVLVETAVNTSDDIPEDYSDYFIFSPAKKIFENIVGEKSVLQQLTEDGLIMGNLTGPTCRNLVVGQANKSCSGNINITHDNFFGIKSEDTFTQYFGSNIKNSEPGDSGMFMTYIFYKTFANNELNLRDSLFKNDKIIHSATDYAKYFKDNKSYYTDLSKLEKGDLIFFGTNFDYFAALAPNIQTPENQMEYTEMKDNTHVGMVTGVNGDIITVAIYNFDENQRTIIEDPKTTVLSKLFNWTYDALIDKGGFKLSRLSINLKQPGGLVPYISGFGKPDYDGFAKEYNDKYAKKIEDLKQSQSTFNPSMGSGVLGYPTEYRKISAGYPNYPSGRYHGGIDFPCPSGTSVYAAQDGVVTTAKKLNNSYGFHIIIDHGNHMQTLYAHNSQLLVRVGDHVKKGQLIAKSGSTGNSTGPHCHFEVRINGQRVNPKNYLGK